MRPLLDTTAQLVLDLLTKSRGPGLRSAIERRTLLALRRRLATARGPLVLYELDGFPIQLPLAHPLPEFRMSYPDFGTNVGRIAAYIQAAYPDARMLDIGANIGDTVATVRSQCDMPILCVEGDRYYADLLRANVRRCFQNVEVRECIVGAETGVQRGEFERADGSGHAMVSELSAGRIDTVALLDLLAGSGEQPTPKFVKVDTDGWDCAILAPAANYLCTTGTVLFFEYDPEMQAKAGSDGPEFLRLLREVGYESLLCHENTGELLVSARLGDSALIADLHRYYSYRYSTRYCDLCVFPRSDERLFATALSAEHSYFESRRRRAM